MANPYEFPTPQPGATSGATSPTSTPRPADTFGNGLFNPYYVSTHVFPGHYTPGGETQQYADDVGPTGVGLPKQNVTEAGADVGRTSLVLAPGMGPNVAQPGEFIGAQEYAPPPPQQQAGGLEMFARMLAEQLLPGEGQHDNVVNLLGLLGRVLGTGLSVFGNLPAGIPMPTEIGGSLFSGQGPQDLFAKLPTTPNKQMALNDITNDPINGLWYINQYLKMNELEIAKGLGVSPLVSDFLVPSQNLGDQVLKILGSAGLPGRLAERTFEDWPLAELDRRFFNPSADVLAHMNPAMLDIRNKYVAGEINEVEAKDLLAKTGFGFRNDVWENMFWELITDPLNLAFGAGIIAKAPVAASFALRAGRVVDLARFGDVAAGIAALKPAEVAAMDAHALQIAMDTRPGLIGRIVNGVNPMKQTALAVGDWMAKSRDLDRLDWLTENGHSRYVDHVVEQMTPREKAIYHLEPFMRGVTKFSENINDIFWAPKTVLRAGIKGSRLGGGVAYRNGQRIAAFSSQATAWGFAAAYGEERLGGLQRFMRSIGAEDELMRSTGRTVANVEAEVHGDNIARKAVAQGAEPKYLPDDAVRAWSEVYHSRVAMTVEGYVRRIKRQILPTGDHPEVKMAQERAVAKERLNNMAGPGHEAEISKFVEAADEDTLALIDHINYGHEIGNFAKARQSDLVTAVRGLETKVVKPLEAEAKAKQAAGKTLSKKKQASLDKAYKDVAALRAYVARMTLIGPKLLTQQRAAAVLKAAKAHDIVAVRDAIERYTQLFMNFSARGLTDDQVLRDMIDLLTDLIDQKGDTLAKEIDVAKEAGKYPELEKFAAKQRDITARMGLGAADEGYVVGLAPEEAFRWRVTRDAEGVITGVNPWLDIVDEISPVPKISQIAAARAKLFNPIRGERVLEEARRKFRTLAVMHYDMSRAEANALFSAIRALADETQLMPRGLSASVLSGLADRMELRPVVRQALGIRGMAKLVAASFEGDLLTVGMTQKLTGRAKRIGADRFGNNWLGVVAEHLYPLLRFSYNPVFLAQEALEPFFWNLLKGVKPGYHWRKEDIRMMESLRMSGFYGEFADQWEYSGAALNAAGLLAAHIIVGPGTVLNKMFRRFTSEGPATKTLAELKKLNYIRSMNRDLGRELRQMLLENSPATWDTLLRETKTTDPTRIANYYYLSKGLFDPDNPHTQVFLMDMAKPEWIAHTAPIHMEPLAKLLHYPNSVELTAAIRDGLLDETTFLRHLDLVNADPGYAARAWETASGITLAEHNEAYTDVLVQGGMTRTAAREQVAAARGVVQVMAKAFGFSEEELMARTFRQIAQHVTSTGVLPSNSMYQIMGDSKTFLGVEIPTQQVEAVQRVTRRALQLAGVPGAEQAAIGLTRQPLGEAARVLDGALATPQVPKGYGVGAENKVGQIDPTKLQPLIIKGEGGLQADRFGAFNDGASLMEETETNLGGKAVESVLDGHARVPGAFHTLVGDMSDEQVWQYVEKNLAVPFDYHWNLRRVEQIGVDRLFTEARALDNMLGEAQIGDLRNRAVGDGDTLFWFVKEEFTGAGIPLKGDPETGIKFANYDGSGTTYGWYGADGELASGVTVKNMQAPLSALEAPGTPLTPQRVRATTGIEGAPPEEMMGEGALPSVNQPYIAKVATRDDLLGQHYYTKLADFVQSEGDHNWADIVGRSSQTEEGYQAALRWLQNRSTDSLREAREEIAARMLTSFAHLMVRSDGDPAKAMSVIATLMDQMTSNKPPSRDLIEEMVVGGLMPRPARELGPMDASEYEKLGADLALLSSSEYNSSTVASVLLHPDIWENAVRFPDWRLDQTLRWLTGDPDAVPPMMALARADGFVDDTVLNDLTARHWDPNTARGTEMTKAPKTGQQYVAQQITKMRQSREKWAEDLNVQPYDLSKMERGEAYSPDFGVTPGDEMTEQDFQHLMQQDIERFVLDDQAAHGWGDVPEAERAFDHPLQDILRGDVEAALGKVNETLRGGAADAQFWRNQRAQMRALVLLNVRQGRVELTDDLVRFLANLSEQPPITPFGPGFGMDPELVRQLREAGLARTEPLRPGQIEEWQGAVERIGMARLRQSVEDALSNVEDEVRLSPAAEQAYQAKLVETGRQAVTRRVTPEMWRNIQKNSAQIAAEWNAEAYLGRTDWTAGKVATVKMANYREAYKSGPRFGADNILSQNAFTVGTTNVPGHFGLNAHRFPNMDDALKSGDIAMIQEMADGQPMINRELMTAWGGEAAALTNTALINMEAGLSRLRVMTKAGKPLTDALGPGGSWTFRGSDDAIRRVVAATAGVHELDQVWALGVDDVRELQGEARLFREPTMEETDAHWGHMLVSDVSFDPGTLTEDIERMADHLYRRMFSEPKDMRSQWVNPGPRPTYDIPAEWYTPDGTNILSEHLDDWNAVMQDYYARKDAWNREWDRGLALGAVSEGEAKYAGWTWTSSAKVEQMPDVQMYTATRYKKSFMAQGPKTRDELGGVSNLGGGPTNTISITPNKAAAERIVEATLEGHAVMNETITLDDLLQRAAKGHVHKFKTQFLSSAAGRFRSSYEGIGSHMPTDQQVWNRVVHKRMVLDETGLIGPEAGLPPKGLKGAGSPNWRAADGTPRWKRYYRPMTDKEWDDAKFDIWRTFLMYQEQIGGGPTDPLFMGGESALHLKNLNPDDVGVVRVRPTTGAQGAYNPSEDEWRVFTGDALQVEGFWGQEPGQQPGWVMAKGADGRRVLRVMHRPPNRTEGNWWHQYRPEHEQQFAWPQEMLDELSSGNWGGPSAKVEQKVVRAHRYDVQQDNGLDPIRQPPAEQAVAAMQQGIQHDALANTNIDPVTGEMQSELLKRRVPGEPLGDYGGSNVRSVSPEDWPNVTRWWAENATDPWLNGRALSRDFPEIGESVRRYYRDRRLARQELLSRKYTPGNWQRKRTADLTKSAGQRGFRMQKHNGRVIAANHVDATGKSAQFFLQNADATSIVHEVLHALVPYLDDSMVHAIHAAYTKAKGLKRASKPVQVGGKPQLTRNVEEWFAHEFEAFAATGTSTDATMQAAFNAFGRVVRKTYGSKLKTANPEAASIFEKILAPANRSSAAATFNPEEWRVMAAAHYALAQAEDEAYKTHYFARGRNVMERSLNHPYLGMYPASYMWGKVVPELVKFLVAEPFGVKAPMWGYSMATTVFQAVQLQLNTDPNFREYVEKHPQLIRFIQMMIPGSPWDIPVSAPAWARHGAELVYKNQARQAKGLPLQSFDIGHELKSSAEYAFGVTNIIDTLGKIGREQQAYNTREGGGALLPSGGTPTPPEGTPAPTLAPPTASPNPTLDPFQKGIQDAANELAPVFSPR